MPNEDVGLAREFNAETKNELRVKKGVGVVDAVLLSFGFTTTNLQHLITPVADGGLGVSLASEGAAITSLLALGVSTIVIAVFITYYMFKIIEQDAEEVLNLIDKQKELEQRQIEFFARLIYFMRLISMSENPNNIPLNNQLKTRLGLNQAAADQLAEIVETVYAEEKGFSRIILERQAHAESEEKAIERYFLDNKEAYLPRIHLGLQAIYIARPAPHSNWRPELMGIFTGIVSFMGMSSGFVGTYYSVVSLVVSIASVSLAIPILGWTILAASLIFGLVIGIMVRRYTDKSIKREEAIDTIREQEAMLSESASKLHEGELMLLNDRIAKLEQKPVNVPYRKVFSRSNSWCGTLFDRRTNDPGGLEPLLLPARAGLVI
jgi:hypothetical protein